MKKIFCYSVMFALLFTVTMSNAANLIARLDRRVITEGESVNLIITLDRRDIVDSPDLTPLRSQFSILVTNAGSQIMVTNGQVQAFSQWQITIAPHQGVEGRVIIPSIKVGQYKTQPIALEVKPADYSKQVKTRKGIFLQADVNTKKPYVQQQILYTLKMFTSEPMANGSIRMAQPEHATVTPAGPEKRYTKIINGQYYQVIERRYWIYPQQSGQIKIDSPELRAIVPTQSGFGYDPFMNSGLGQTIRILGPAITLNVQAKPADFKGQWWLAAKNMEMSERWSPAKSTWRVGDAITRTITLRAVGANASQLPDITLKEDDALNIYPDQSERKDEMSNNGVVGIRQQKFAIVPTRAGKLVLPEVKVPWWNTKTNQEMYATLPARTITVLPVAQVSDKSETPVVLSAPKKEAPMKTPVENANPKVNGLLSEIHGLWIAIVTVLLVWLMTVLVWWRSRRSAMRNETNVSAAKIRAKLKSACDRNQALEAKKLLIEFAKSHWRNVMVHNLSDVANCVNTKECKTVISNLDKVIYSGQSIPWDGSEFWKIFTSALKRSKKSNPQKAPDLPSLHPDFK